MVGVVGKGVGEGVVGRVGWGREAGVGKGGWGGVGVGVGVGWGGVGGGVGGRAAAAF